MKAATTFSNTRYQVMSGIISRVFFIMIKHFGNEDAGIVVSKSGYINDTIYFNSNTSESYWSNFIISLIKDK